MSRPLPHLPIALIVASLLLGTGCAERISLVAGIKAGGELRVATVASGTTFERVADGYRGFEHDLTSAFAAWLGVKPRYVVARDYAHLRELVASGRAHLGASLIPVPAKPTGELHYGPSYAAGRQLVVHRRDKPRPRETSDLINWRGATVVGRGAALLLDNELPNAGGYEWESRADLAVSELLARVDRGELDYAVLPSFDFEARRRYFPELRVGFELGDPQAVAWVYRGSEDTSLGRAQIDFFRDIRQRGEFDAIVEDHFGHVDEFDYVESRTFMRDYANRLPKFKSYFLTAAQNYGFDWRLLAAVSYQESHWRNDARSPTGVRGLMMLTKSTADQLGVDRMIPEQSIDGGARYLARMKQRLPERIVEPELSLFALAAYNVGLGHLEDARVLAEKAGSDPDRWETVRPFLAKLSNREWAKRARHGYARGYQALHFVDNIQRYYDTLRWIESDRLTAETLLLEAPAALVTPAL